MNTPTVGTYKEDYQYSEDGAFESWKDYEESAGYEYVEGVVSDCCGVSIIEGSQVCMACKDHCGSEKVEPYCNRCQGRCQEKHE